MKILGTHVLDMVSSSDTSETSGLIERYLPLPKLTQLGDRHCPSKVGGLRMGALTLAIVEFGAPMRLDADVGSDDYIWMSCLRGSAEIDVDGQQIRLTHGQAFLARPCESMVGNFSPDCVRLALRIRHDFMKSVSFPVLDKQMDTVTSEMAPLLDQLQLILASQSLMRAVCEDPAVSLDMERLLVSLLKSCQRQAMARPRKQTSIVSRDVRRTEVFIRTHAQDPICLDDFVRVSGVSARTLQGNFMRFRQISPMHFLREVRLEMAHKRLLDRQDDVPVSNIALDCGFNHLGRFSKFYRERYGESPSETLRRSTQVRSIG